MSLLGKLLRTAVLAFRLADYLGNATVRREFLRALSHGAAVNALERAIQAALVTG